MNFKLENFFIGVVELFSIILPGSIMTFFILCQIDYKEILKTLCINPAITFSALPDEYKWAAFLIAAYIIGHIINTIGSKLLDDLYYDKGIRKFYTKNFDLAFFTATDIKDKFLNSKELKKNFFTKEKKIQKEYLTCLEKKIKKNDGGENKSITLKECADDFIKNKKIEILNTFKWIKRFLSLNNPDILTEVNRLEADQKFFRSLTIVFFIIGIWLGINLRKGLNIYILIFCLIGIFFSLLCLWNYGKIRFKTTEAAFQFIIAIYHNKNKANKK